MTELSRGHVPSEACPFDSDGDDECTAPDDTFPEAIEESVETIWENRDQLCALLRNPEADAMKQVHALHGSILNEVRHCEEAFAAFGSGNRALKSKFADVRSPETVSAMWEMMNVPITENLRGVTKDAIRTTLLCSFVQGCVLRALPPELLHNILKAIEWVMLKVVWTTCYALQPLLLSRFNRAVLQKRRVAIRLGILLNSHVEFEELFCQLCSVVSFVLGRRSFRMDCYMAGAIDAIKRAVVLHNSSIVQQHVCLVLKSFTNQFLEGKKRVVENGILDIVYRAIDENIQDRNLLRYACAVIRNCLARSADLSFTVCEGGALQYIVRVLHDFWDDPMVGVVCYGALVNASKSDKWRNEICSLGVLDILKKGITPRMDPTLLVPMIALTRRICRARNAAVLVRGMLLQEAILAVGESVHQSEVQREVGKFLREQDSPLS